MPQPAELLRHWLSAAVPAAAVAWLDERVARTSAGDLRAFQLALGMAGRQVGRTALSADRAQAEAARPGWDPTRWSADQAARTLLVLALPAADPQRWLTQLDACFHAATLDELIALYQALPLLPHADLLAPRAAEGVRHAATAVLAAIALDNPFPCERLADAALNQMVLKCFFNGLDTARIVGLPGRHNPDLGRMLAHYARERRIAKRPVDPALPPLARACGADCPD